MTLTAVKHLVQPGQVYDVTNHYITRTDHPAYGTTRRKVTKVTGSSVYLGYVLPSGDVVSAEWPTFAWPKASQVQADDDGTVRLYGMGAGQPADALFLTLKPVLEGS